MTWRYFHAGLSDTGRVRTQNEDRWAVDPAFGLYVVSDGVGGHFAGALASRVVVETLPPLLKECPAGIRNVTDSKVAEAVVTAIAELSDRLYDQSRQELALDGMGATVVLALVRDGNALIAHLGDSRAYLYREGLLEQLTRDHSIVQLLVDNDEISPEEASDHPARGQITRFVGMAGEAIPNARVVSLHPNDHLLLCSDGLTDLLSDEEILAVYQTIETPHAICRRLVDNANTAGGRDNITVVDVFAEQITGVSEGSGSFAPFPTTAWTLIRQAQQSEPSIRQEALDQLVRRYWKPLYAFYRSKGQSQQDAQDLVQECLWSLSRDGLSRLEQGEPKFRSWLMTCARNLMVDWLRRKNANRRASTERAVSFERIKAEDGAPFEPAGGESPEDAFQKTWRRSILERAIESVRQLCTKRMRTADFEVFLEYYEPSAPHVFEDALALPNEVNVEDASKAWATEGRVSWQDIAERRGLVGWKAAARKAEWVKRQLAGAIRDEIRLYADSDSEVEEEIRELLR